MFACVGGANGVKFDIWWYYENPSTIDREIKRPYLCLNFFNQPKKKVNGSKECLTVYFVVWLTCAFRQSWKKRVLWILKNPIFLRFSASLYCFPPKSYQISLNFIMFDKKCTKFNQSLPNFAKLTKYYQIFTQCLPNFTKFVVYAVLSQYQIVQIYAFFPRQICISENSELTQKIPTLPLADFRWPFINTLF